MMIQIIMGVTATVIVIACKAPIKNVVCQSTMMSGLIGLIALFGIAWLADTWIAANEAQIVDAMGELVEQWRWFIAIAIFIVAALTTSQAAALAAIVPIGLTLGIPPQFLVAFSTACIGIYFFPANGSQVTAIATDETGIHEDLEVRRLALVLAPDVRDVALVDGGRLSGRRPGLRHVVSASGRDRTLKGGSSDEHETCCDVVGTGRGRRRWADVRARSC